MKTMKTMRTMRTNCQEDFYSLFEFNQLEQAALFHAPAIITSRPSSRLAEHPTQNPTQQASAKNRKTESKQLACPELSQFYPKERG